MFIGLWVNIRVFYSIPLVDFSVFMPIPSCFYYCSSVIKLDVKDGEACRSFFFFLLFGTVGYPGFFVITCEVISGSVNHCVGILMGIALNL